VAGFGAGIDHVAVAHTAWAALGDPRSITGVEEASANVSTNRVYRLLLSDGTRLYTKVSNYGSYFLFAEDHDRIHRWNRALADTRFRHLLARSIEHDGRAWTYYDGEVWAVFYNEVPLGQRLPRVLDDHQIVNLAEEMAEFHRHCSAVAARIPLTSKSIKSDAITLLDQLTNPFSAGRFRFEPHQLWTAQRHCHDFLMTLDRLGYDDVPKIPVLIDWNLGNFSVEANSVSADEVTDRFRLLSRWDYDWFRIEPRSLDFYFLSRVSSSTGDRTQFSYSSHTLTEARFVRFLIAYHRINPLTEVEIDLIAESYRFFILNYVVREGDAFFQRNFSNRFRRDAVNIYLPEYERLDMQPVKDLVLG
jgi:hypothetical protein